MLSVKGIEPVYPVAFRQYYDIVLAFSQVPLEKYSEETFHEKIAYDLAWIDEKARRHTFIVELLHERYDLIPFRFWTIYKDGQTIDALLREHYNDFKQLLSRVKGKTEWSIKVYCQEQKFLKNYKQEQDTSVRAVLDETGQGKSYLMKKKMEKNMQSDLRNRMLKELDFVIDTLKKRFPDYFVGECYDSDSAKDAGKMLYNCSVLAPRGDVAAVVETTRELNGAVNREGLIIELSGPWPPYSFTFMELDPTGGN